MLGILPFIEPWLMRSVNVSSAQSPSVFSSLEREGQEVATLNQHQASPQRPGDEMPLGCIQLSLVNGQSVHVLVNRAEPTAQ